MSDKETTKGGASVDSFNYLETLWVERTDEPFPTEKFEERDQTNISALIDRILEKPALPTISETLLDEIKDLADKMGESYEVSDRAQASRIVRQLRRRANAKKFAEAREAADAELDELLVPVL